MNGSGTVVNRFSRGLGHLIHSYHHGFYLFNVRTDVVQRVDNQGNVIHTYRYDAFGNQLNGNETNTNPFRFAAEYYDWETGFIYLRARFYNPAIGRFISEDPHWTIRNMQSSVAAIMQSSNLFVFAVNNPVMWIDPSGRYIVLPTNRRDRDTILNSLQKLTDHSLSATQVNLHGNNVYRLTVGAIPNDARGRLRHGNALINRMASAGRSYIVNIVINHGNTLIDGEYRTGNWWLRGAGNIGAGERLGSGRLGTGTGRGGTIYFDPNHISTPKVSGPNGRAMWHDTPAHIGLAHELIHADRSQRGAARGGHTSTLRYMSHMVPVSSDVFAPVFAFDRNETGGLRFGIEDLATIGISHVRPGDITENMIRAEQMIPLRISYSPRPQGN